MFRISRSVPKAIPYAVSGQLRAGVAHRTKQATVCVSLRLTNSDDVALKCDKLTHETNFRVSPTVIEAIR
jgi:hypothetical protein